MINVLVPVVEQPEKYAEFVNKISLQKDVKVFVGVRSGLVSKLNVSTKKVDVLKFSDNSNLEEIINSMHSCKMQKGKILIVRRPLDENEYKNLTNSEKDIATLRAGHSKIVLFFKKLAKWIVRKFFAFSFFEDISAICYNENLFELLSVCTNLSLASRLNRYVGIEIEEFQTKTKQVKKTYSRWRNALVFLLWTILFCGSVAGGVLLCIFTPLRAITVIAVIFWIFLALFLWAVGLVNFIRTIAVGNLRYGRAEEVFE